MADGYTIDHIIQDCITDKAGSRNQSLSARGNVFEESWEALNSWIESRLCKRKGASIGMFGTFTWEIKQENGETLSRPIFILADSFVKDHHVKRQRILSIPLTAANEEINYSKLAIKFSKTLTKDVVFSCIRDIIKKIAEYIERSYKFNVAFRFGSLKSNERKVKFEFDYSRFSQFLPENFQPESFSSRTSRLEDDIPSMNKDQQNGNGLQIQGGSMTQVQSDNNNNSYSSAMITGPTAAGADYNDNEEEEYNDDDYLQHNNDNLTDNDDYISTKSQSDSNYNPQFSPETQKRIESLRHQDRVPTPSLAKSSRRLAANQNVLEQAYQRCLNVLEVQAFNEDLINHYSKEGYETWLHQQKNLKEQNKMKSHELEEYLKSQITEFHEKRKSDRKERKAAQIKHELPGYIPSAANQTSSDNKSSNSTSTKLVSTKDLVSSLEEQIRLNKEKKIISRKEKLEEEREYLDHVAMEFELQSAAERAASLEKQSILLEAWEREAHIRNLKKLKNKGMEAVSMYMQSNLDEQGPVVSKSKATMMKMGVGYDARKFV
eukprot:gene8028-16452_t